MIEVKYLLDTNICIYLINKKSQYLLKKFITFTPGNLAVSSITVSELYYGVYKSHHIEKNLRALHNFLLPLDIVTFDDNASRYYGELRSQLEKSGTPIGSMDLLIAAHAVSINVPIVTNNTKEFLRVPNLLVENWVEEELAT